MLLIKKDRVEMLNQSGKTGVNTLQNLPDCQQIIMDQRTLEKRTHQNTMHHAKPGMHFLSLLACNHTVQRE